MRINKYKKVTKENGSFEYVLGNLLSHSTMTHRDKGIALFDVEKRYYCYYKFNQYHRLDGAARMWFEDTGKNNHYTLARAEYWIEGEFHPEIKNDEQLKKYLKFRAFDL